MDWPASFYYSDLMEAYPDAKVLLSVRSGESWERSMENTIWGTFYGDMLVHDLSTAWGRGPKLGRLYHPHEVHVGKDRSPCW